MERICSVCDYPFKDEDKIVAVMLSTFHHIPSDVHYAISEPKVCVEIIHRACYDFPSGEPPEEGQSFYPVGGDS